MMGTCPICGTFIDAGEPYCPDCGYIEESDSTAGDSETVEINGYEYLLSDVEEALREYDYDMFDLKNDLIDEENLELILDDLERL